jgi:hypothetical protein
VQQAQISSRDSGKAIECSADAPLTALYTYALVGINVVLSTNTEELMQWIIRNTKNIHTTSSGPLV